MVIIVYAVIGFMVLWGAAIIYVIIGSIREECGDYTDEQNNNDAIQKFPKNKHYRSWDEVDWSKLRKGDRLPDGSWYDGYYGDWGC